MFWSLTWDDYERIVKGYYHRLETDWLHTRWLGTLIYNANSKRPKTPEQLVPLSLDKKTKKPAATSQTDADRILNKYKHILNPTNG